MKNRNRVVLIVALWLMAAPLVAEEPAQYIVILKRRAAASPDVAALGGRIESRQDEQMVVTLPPEAVEKLRGDPAVLYLQRVGGGDDAPDESALIGTPEEPRPGAPRLRPQPLGNTPKDLGTYSYDGAGNIVAIGSDIYRYDGAQRLKRSTTNGTIETFTYDGFGNLESTIRGGQQTTFVVSKSKNQLNSAGLSYDGAGNMVTGESYTFTYDAVGQPLSKTYPGVDPEYYVYTASDERIGVRRGGWWTWSLRDEGGKVLRQYRSSATSPINAAQLWIEDYVWRDGLLLGSNRPAAMGGRRHYHLDHLGTPRLVTSDGGQKMSGRDYYAFGAEQTLVVQEGPGAAGFDREEPPQFTGHERDFAGGPGAEDSHYIDYMHARYYSPTLGRFLSVDPGGFDPKKPQSWNRYAYVQNNPMLSNDPNGRETNPVTGGSGIDDSQLRTELNKPDIGKFGAPRIGHLHGGVDIAAPLNTKLVAPVGGVVLEGNDPGDGGLWVQVTTTKANGDVVTAHMSHLNSVTVKTGDRVMEGQPVGRSGDTGNAKRTSPHVHLAVFVNGQRENPQQWFAKNPSKNDWQRVTQWFRKKVLEPLLKQ